MALLQDQKFSTFQDGGDLAVGDTIVGLRGGVNTKFDYDGTLPPGVIVPIVNGGTGADNAAAARVNLGLEIGVDVQAWSASLDALSALGGNGIVVQTGANTFANRTLTGTLNQIAIVNSNGVSGNPTISLPSDVIISNSVQAGNLKIEGNSLVSVNANGNINLDPDGTGRTRAITSGLRPLDLARESTAQPFTDFVPADVLGSLALYTPNDSGLVIQGFSTSASNRGLRLQGHSGNATVTIAPSIFESYKTNGTTGRVALSGTEPAFSWYVGDSFAGGTELMTLLANGSLNITGQLNVDNINLNGTTITTTGNLNLAPSTFQTVQSQVRDGAVIQTIRNTSTGTSAITRMILGNDTGNGYIQVYGSNNSSIPEWQNKLVLSTDSIMDGIWLHGGTKTISMSTVSGTTPTFVMNTSGQIGLGLSAANTARPLDILASSTPLGLRVTGSVTDSSDKLFKFGSRHYTNAEEDVMWMYGLMQSSTNRLLIGGGSSIQNACTSVEFYLGATSTTTSGTKVAEFTSVGLLMNNSVVRLASYTVAGVPSAATSGAGAQIYVTNETGGAVPAFSDGTDWRRVTDRAIIS